jgi:hypothetical protein
MALIIGNVEVEVSNLFEGKGVTTPAVLNALHGQVISLTVEDVEENFVEVKVRLVSK